MKTKKTETETKTEATATEGQSMGEKLQNAGKKAEKAQAARRERTVKGAHLLKDLTDPKVLAGLTTVDKSGFTLVTGVAKGRKVYIAKKGGRVDLSGFSVEADAVIQISEEDARQKHLGKVRGMIDFDKSDDAVKAAFSAALEKLKEQTEEPKPAKAETKAAE